MNTIKIAHPDHPIHQLLQNRWSARSFTGEPINTINLQCLFEAARWAPSANNEQPWHFTYAHHGTPGFEAIWSVLMPGNQPWAKNAAILMLASVATHFEGNQQPNTYAWHDLGLATTQLLLQATSLNIHGHVMAGFDKAKAKTTLNLPNHLEPVTVIALGYLAPAEALEEPFKTRELTARSRKSIATFTAEI